MSLPFPLTGTTLATGPSGTGRTRLTHRGLNRWVDEHGPDGVVVLEFAPGDAGRGRSGRGRLERVGPLPDGVHVARLDARAPRAEGGTDAQAAALARANADRAAALLEDLPDTPRAVFVNDATVPFQHHRGEVDDLTGYCDRAACAVINAFEDEALGTDDPVVYRERRALERLHAWADRSIALEPAE